MPPICSRHKRPRSPWVINSKRSLPGAICIGLQTDGARAPDDGAAWWVAASSNSIAAQVPAEDRKQSIDLNGQPHAGRGLGMAGLQEGTFLLHRLSNKRGALPKTSGVALIYRGRQLTCCLLSSIVRTIVKNARSIRMRLVTVTEEKRMESLARPEDSPKAWYLIQCKSRQDERAEENLLRQGYSCYRPKYRRQRLVRGIRQTLEESLFCGYLFIQLGLEENWAPLRSTRGLLRVVGFGGKPLAIDGRIIYQLQQRACTAVVGRPFLSPGEKVRIAGGPFAEIEAIFQSMSGDERVVLLLNFLHREQKIHMPLDNIYKI